MFIGIGSVQKRIFLFGGKEQETKEISCKAYELEHKEDGLHLIPINRMIKNRSRSTIASIDMKIGNIDPFIVIVGGSDQFHSLSLCELYYPKTDTYYSFPNLNIQRENASICLLDQQKQNGSLYIYCFGGFDKKSIDQIERVRIEFDENRNMHPLVSTKWEMLKNISMVKSVECCGTFQLTENEIMIFGGFQKGEDISTQVVVFNAKSYSFLGLKSRLNFTDCF